MSQTLGTVNRLSNTNNGFLKLLDQSVSFPVFMNLCDHFGIGEIVALTRTCKQLSGLYRYLLPLIWNIDKRLQWFFTCPTAFRSRMAATDAVISGSFAIQVFVRVHWDKSDLDVFVENGERAKSICEYLEANDNYKLYAETDAEYEVEPENGIHHVYKYKRPQLPPSQNKDIADTNMKEDEVQVIAMKAAPASLILAGFYSSAVINMISWNAAYSIFPLYTFQYYKSIFLKDLEFAYEEEHIKDCVRKYKARGWAIEPKLRAEDKKKIKNPFRLVRRVGDEFTWKISFNTQQVTWSKTPDTVMEYAHFFPMRGFGPSGISTNHFTAHCLKYSYAAGPTWMEFQGNRCERLTLFELRHLKLADRPDNYEELVDFYNPVRLFLEPIAKPDYWTYYDSEIPRWYEAWKAELTRDWKE